MMYIFVFLFVFVVSELLLLCFSLILSLSDDMIEGEELRGSPFNEFVLVFAFMPVFVIVFSVCHQLCG